MENKELTEQRNTVRHNKLINARIKLNAKAYDLTRSFISLVEREDSDFWTYSLSVAELGIDYKEAKAVIRNIMRNPVEISNDGKEVFEAYSWFTTMKYSKGVIEARINSDLKDMMLQLTGNYTKILEKYVFPMNSIYAKRLYELLAEYKKIGYRKFVLEDLQDKLQVGKSLRRFSDFKKNVLRIAVEQINLHTDIYLELPLADLKSEEWIALQCGKERGITHLNFCILDNPNNVNTQKIILKWVDKVRATHINQQLMRYNKSDYDGYLSVSTKGYLYLQDKMGNSMGIDIEKDKSWLLWEWMYNNQSKTLIGNING